MANFLYEEKMDVEVITQTIESAYIDESLDELLRKSLFKVTRIPLNKKLSNSQSYYFSIEDDVYKKWHFNLLKYLHAVLVDETNINIIVSLPPFSVGNLILNIRKRYSKINIICDFRDAWSQWNVSPYASWFHYFLTLKKENKVISTASWILTTSEVTQHDFKELHPNVPRTKFVLVTNSFDNYLSLPKIIRYTPKDKFRIGYVGSFYYNPNSHHLMFKKWYQKRFYQFLQYVPNKEDWKYRSPFFLFQIIQELIREVPELNKRIEINFVGNYPDWMNEMIHDFGLDSIVNLMGFMEKNNIEKFQNEQDFLLITSSKRIGKNDYSIAGKTFEYLSVMKPILTLVNDGALKELLNMTGCCVMLNPDNVESAKTILLDIINNGCELKPKYNFIDKYLTKNAMKPILDLIRTEK